MNTVPHDLRWNKDLQEWFCATCGRTSDHTAEADARMELGQFDCILVGSEKKKLTPEDRKKLALMKKIQKKF